MQTVQSKNGRGALYIVWGDKCDRDLDRATAAVRNIHPELPIEVVRLEQNEDGLHARAKMFSLSPFRETVYLDADTLVLSRLDFAFEKAAQFGLACCINPDPWARKHAAVDAELIEYNAGVLFFTEAARRVFEAWEWLTEHRARGHKGHLNGKLTDASQGPFAAAVERSRFNPFVLPPNWNFLPNSHRAFIAPLKIWHCNIDPPAELLKRAGEIWMPENRRAHTFHRTGKNLVRFLTRQPLL